jgi:outer membrane protein assembly factor BamB
MKRNWMISLLLLVITISGCKRTNVGENAWMSFRGNASNTGFYEGSAPHELTELKWKFKTEGWVFSSPAVSDGMVFFGSDDTYLYAVDIKTGQEKWKFKTEGRVESSPAVSDGMVFFGSSDHYLYAVNIKTGQEKWKFKTEGAVESSPAVSDGMVFFGSVDHYLYAVK